jgi:excisionase family DNA binding protein
MDLLTVSETAQMLKVATITVRRYIADGRLKAVRVGKGIRVPMEAVERFIQPVLEPARWRRVRRPLRQRGKPITQDDPMTKGVGLASSPRPTDASTKHEYLAEALDRVPTLQKGEERLLPSLSEEEIARRKALVEQILANRAKRSIAPLTTADLLEEVRRENERAYARWLKRRNRGRRLGGGQVASGG